MEAPRGVELTGTNSPCVLFFEKNPSSLINIFDNGIYGGHISARILKCDKARTPRAKGMGKDAHDRARGTAQRRQISKDAPKFLWWP